VNLLPFIDIKLLKDTIATYCPDSKLSAIERRRNSMGKVYGYRFDPTCTDIVESPDKTLGLPDISASSSSVTIIEDVPISSSVTFKPELLPGSIIPYPGFPSLSVFPIASMELKRIGLNCFGTASKYLTMLLTMHQMPELPALEVLASNVLGKSLFVNWPMMHEGQVVAISDCEKEIRLVKGNHVTKMHTALQRDQWTATSDAMYDMYFVGNGQPGAGGVNIGDIRVRLKVLPLQGMKTNANGSTKKIFGQSEADVPLQLALWNAPAPDPRFKERGPMTLEDRFPVGCNVLLTKGKYRGCLGVTMGVADKKNVAVKVYTVPAEIPFGLAIARTVQESFVSSAEAANILKMHSGIFGRITGRLQFNNKYDLGLNLKTTDGMCVVGYTRKKVEKSFSKNKKEEKKIDAWGAGDSVLVVGSVTKSNGSNGYEEKIQWEYTPKAIRLVEEYRRKFPQLFAALKLKPNEKKYEADEIFGPNGKAWLPVVREWLDNHETAKLPRTPVTTEALSYEAVAAVQRAADARTLALKKRGPPQYSVIKVPGIALYREASTGPTDILTASDYNDSQAPELGDRVANLCANGIPFSARGTVVAIHEAATTGSVEVVMDEEFIGGTSLQGACSNYRGKLCLWAHLIKITPENSNSYMDKLIPRGQNNKPSHHTVNKIISSIDKQGNDDGREVTPKTAETAQPVQSPTRAIKQKDTKSNTAAEPTSSTKSNATASARVTTPKRPPSAPSDSRAGSTGRGRKIAWREAKGPNENDVGFKGLRQGGVSGYQKWKKIVTKEQKKQGATTGSTDSTTIAEDLKKKLGISIQQPPPAHTTPSKSPSNAAAAFELKSILGVNAKKNTTEKAVQPSDPTKDLKAVLGIGIPTPPVEKLSDAAGLKALLGVQPTIDVPIVVPAPPTQPPENSYVTAADKLLRMLSSKQPQGPVGPQFMPMPMNRPSGFNFTYVDVEDGKEMSPTDDVTAPHIQYPHPPPPPPPPHFAGYPMPPPMGPPHPGFYGPAGGPPPMPPHPGFHGVGPMPPPFNPNFGFTPQQPIPPVPAPPATSSNTVVVSSSASTETEPN
jgi:5'-3' exoribonuclease 1